MAFRGFLETGRHARPDPERRLCGRILLDLHEAHQSWDDAVKHYHSAAPEKNVGYHRRVLAELERFLEAGMPAPSASDTAPAATSGSDSTELALVTRPVTRPTPPAVPAVAPAPVPPAPAPTEASSAVLDRAPASAASRQEKPAGSFAAPAPFLDSQPNLAPHRARVEHFRRLLSRDPG